MGVDYHVALDAADWPTMQAVQQCIDERGWPVKLGTKGDPRWPFDRIQGSLPVTFESEPLRLEASLITLSPTSSFGYWFDRPRTSARTEQKSTTCALGRISSLKT
jgi:hypothetical protein